MLLREPLACSVCVIPKEHFCGSQLVLLVLPSLILAVAPGEGLTGLCSEQSFSFAPPTPVRWPGGFQGAVSQWLPSSPRPKLAMFGISV